MRRYGFRFPVAVDVSWSTLERWWLRGHARDPAYASVRAAIERLLAEP